MKRCVNFLANSIRHNEMMKAASYTAGFVVPSKKITKSFHS